MRKYGWAQHLFMAGEVPFLLHNALAKPQRGIQNPHDPSHPGPGVSLTLAPGKAACEFTALPEFDSFLIILSTA